MLQTKTYLISGMHCTSCAFNIDGELEDTEGVREAITHYAKQETRVTFDDEKITAEGIVGIIKKVGYEAKEATQ